MTKGWRKEPARHSLAARGIRTIGFTGTRAGMTNAQRLTFRKLLVLNEVQEFHHGGCVGADAEAHKIAMEKDIPIHVHPSNIKDKSEMCEDATVKYVTKSPLERNREIVDSVDELIAVPKTEREQLRSGTWATIRYAKKKGVPIKIIEPDGSVKEYG
jgi:hypothetical protein